MQEAWDYFEGHGLDGFSKNGDQKIRIWASWDGSDEDDIIPEDNPNGARYFPGKLVPFRFGEFMGDVDVVGHEFTHAVDFHHRKIARGNGLEARTLSESFGDIFGELTELFATGQVDWIAGERTPVQGRNFSFPSASNQPSILYGTLWGEDPHINTGVSNKWFSKVVSTLGSVDLAEQFIFLIMTKYAQSDMTFRDMRTASYMAAIEMFGPCSSHPARILARWDEVGVFYDDELIICPEETFQIYGPTLICEEEFGSGESYEFTVPAVFANDLSWTAPSHWTYTEVGQSLVLTDIDLPLTTTFPHFETIYVSTEGESTVQLNIIFEDCNQDGIIKSPSFDLNKPPKYAKGQYQVFPNPSDGGFRIQVPGNIDRSKLRFSVTDLEGKTLYSQATLLDKEYRPDLVPGVYIVNIFVEGITKAATLKLIVQRK